MSRATVLLDKKPAHVIIITDNTVSMKMEGGGGVEVCGKGKGEEKSSISIDEKLNEKV